MDPIRGTNVSLAMAYIAMQGEQNRGQIDMAAAKLALDAMRGSGQQLVQMLEGLGQNIDTYA